MSSGFMHFGYLVKVEKVLEYQIAIAFELKMITKSLLRIGREMKKQKVEKENDKRRENMLKIHT